MGYFSESALIHTDETIKTINEIKIGDRIINKYGEFEPIEKISKTVDSSNLVKITHVFGTNTYFPMICTEDSNILIKDKNKVALKKAINLKKGDYICAPKFKPKVFDNLIIDLNEYNIFGYEFDNDYIYEKISSPGAYKYSPMDVSRHIGTSFSLIEQFARLDCKKKLFSRKPEKLKALFEYVPFKTREEYAEYVESFRIRKIPRFLEIDEEFNKFIGLMYGDGYTKNKVKNWHSYYVGLSINPDNHKAVINQEIFFNVAKKLNLNYSRQNRYERGRCAELSITSKLFSYFVCTEIFESKLGKSKQFNKKWFNQTLVNLQGILKGLILSDGTETEKYESFCNTSPSLVNACKLLYLMTNNGVPAIEYRKGTVCSLRTNGNIGKPAMNIRKSKSDRNIVNNDDLYYYIPVKNIERITTNASILYCLHTKTNSGILLNNMIIEGAA